LDQGDEPRRLDPATLHLIYNLSHSQTSDAQDSELVDDLFGRGGRSPRKSVRDLILLLQQFAESDRGAKYRWAARCLSERSATASPIIRIKWLEPYGCAMVCVRARSTCKPLTSEVHIDIVGLDDWGFRTHSWPGGVEFTSICSGAALISAGSVSDEALDDFCTKFDDILKRKRSVTGEQRSAEHNEQGHQKTPAFIWALVQDAIKSVSQGELPEKPPGAFTDVGRHTGGKARATPWPLVQAVLHLLLGRYQAGAVVIGPDPVTAAIPAAGTAVIESDPRVFLDLMIADLGLWVANRLLLEAPSRPSGPREAVEVEAVEVLRHVVRTLAPLAERGQDTRDYEERCEGIRKRVHELAVEGHRSSGQHILPDLGPGQIKLLDVSLNLPADNTAEEQSGSQGLEAARALARSRLVQVKLLDPIKTSIVQLREFVEETSRTVSKRSTGPDPHTRLRLQLALNTADAFLYRHIMNFDESDDGSIAADPNELGVWELFLDGYRDVYSKLLLMVEGGRGRMLKELRSRELLAGWIVFCIVHATVAGVWPLVKNYGLALRWSDLQHCLLHDVRAWEAVRKVESYLKQYDDKVGMPLFSLRDPVSTFRFAQKVGEMDQQLQQQFQSEQERASQLQHGYWKEVTEKKAEAQRLREELTALTEGASEIEIAAAEISARLCDLCRTGTGRLCRTPFCVATDRKVISSWLRFGCKIGRSVSASGL
jgi:hypothetical protein